VNRLTFEKVENRYPFGDNEVIEKNPHHFEIYNSRKEKIGRIMYLRVGTYMHWCFFPDECDGHDLFFTNGCLREIVDFISSLYKKNTKEVRHSSHL